MDAAKIAWVMYEHPEVDFEDLAMRFMDIRKRIYKFPKLGAKATLVAIPTTSGTGSEVTRNAVLASPERRVKASLRSAGMLPRLAVVDPALTYSLPRAATAASGLDAITQLIEPYVSVRANPMADLFCVEGLKSARTAPDSLADRPGHVELAALELDEAAAAVPVAVVRVEALVRAALAVVAVAPAAGRAAPAPAANTA